MIKSFFAVAALMATVAVNAQTMATTDVVKLPSGVMVEHLEKGTGAKPVASDTVLVHYEGKLLDGKVFDSSYKRGQPISFPLAGVVPCWTQGVAQMAVGGTALLTCPSDTAYGARGVPNVIPPNSVLKFKVNLIEIVKN